MMSKIALPIDPFLPEILQTLDAKTNLIIQASPGSGKTTRVPPALLHSSFLKSEEQIFVLVPRRLAAKMAALRVAEELGEKVGETVGYQFRFENVSSAKTRLKFLTEGLLLRHLMTSPELKGVGCVILDEFHERHMHSDVAISYLKWLQKTKRPDLRLVVMSATLDVAAVKSHLDDAQIVEVKTPVFPVAIHYAAQNSKQRLEEQVVDALANVKFKNTCGREDVLVFLPGMGDILRSADALRQRFKEKFLILPLHGDLPKEEQALVFEETEKKKIILSTNVAESSLTIPGVTTVIDSGLHRQASYSWWSGVPSLKTRPISRASAIQRAGRAGRTAPGQCLRLYTQADFSGRAEFEVPEIRRADLAQTLLEIKNLGFQNLSQFPWFEAPQPSALAASIELLYNLGALTANLCDAPLTPLGRKMAGLPLHPRLARFLLAADERHVLSEASLLAARISEQDLSHLDVLDHLEDKRITDATRRLRQQILSYFPQGKSQNQTKDISENLAQALLAAFPDRVACRRKTAKREVENDLVFCFGGSGAVPSVDVVSQNEYFVILDVQERKGQTQMRAKVHVSCLCAIHADWLLSQETTFLQEHDETIWNEQKACVQDVSQLRYGSLVLSESASSPKNPEAASLTLLKALLKVDGEKIKALSLSEILDGLKPFSDTEAAQDYLCRLKLLQQYFPEHDLAFDAKQNEVAWFLHLIAGCTSVDDLRGEKILDQIKFHLPYDVQNLMEKELPMFLTLPSGRRSRIHYEWDKSPWIASRLQDFLGLGQSPKILRGRLSLTIHLLAPNQRAVQVTSDLTSFWKNTYPELRPQLSRRYPRHAWPENPLQAIKEK